MGGVLSAFFTPHVIHLLGVLTVIGLIGFIVVMFLFLFRKTSQGA
jgi:hypothetical protein